MLRCPVCRTSVSPNLARLLSLYSGQPSGGIRPSAAGIGAVSSAGTRLEGGGIRGAAERARATVASEAEGQNRVHRSLVVNGARSGTGTGTGTGSVMRFDFPGRHRNGSRNGVGSGTRTSPLMQTNGLHGRELALESGDDSDGTETEAQRNRSAFLHDEELRAEEERLLSYIREREAGTRRAALEEPRGSSRQEPRAPPSTISAAISASRERMEMRGHVRQQVSRGLEALNQTAPRGVEGTAGRVERCFLFRV
jgi:hypothetical protein